MSGGHLFIVSGGMGSSGERLVRTALAQFPNTEASVIVRAGVRTEDELRRAVDQAAEAGGAILHTLVDARLRARLVQLATERGVAEVDLIGPVLTRMEALFGQPPLGTPGRYRQLRADYFERVEAIEFAVAHDDGRNCHELPLADVVIVGVSRSGKTPLCMYLAMGGVKAANVPVAPTIEPPAELFEVDRGRVVGLTVEPERLVAYRRLRQRDLGATASTSYSDPRQTARDLEHAEQLFRRRRIATIDVTSRPVEETASEVMALVGHRGTGVR